MTARQTIKSLAAEIQQRWPKLQVKVERGYCNTDRKIGRLRWPGKGRWASRLVVTDAKGNLLLDHNNAETYRRTREVRAWIDDCVKLGKPVSWSKLRGLG
jgi:hypothetical protein